MQKLPADKFQGLTLRLALPHVGVLFRILPTKHSGQKQQKNSCPLIGQVHKKC